MGRQQVEVVHAVAAIAPLLAWMTQPMDGSCFVFAIATDSLRAAAATAWRRVWACWIAVRAWNMPRGVCGDGKTAMRSQPPLRIGSAIADQQIYGAQLVKYSMEHVSRPSSLGAVSGTVGGARGAPVHVAFGWQPAGTRKFGEVVRMSVCQSRRSLHRLLRAFQSYCSSRLCRNVNKEQS
jgi:hypothetical protein